MISTTNKATLVQKIIAAGIVVNQKQADEFNKYETMVISATPTQKSKLDRVMQINDEAVDFQVVEFDEGMWRLISDDAADNLTQMQRAKEFQEG